MTDSLKDPATTTPRSVSAADSAQRGRGDPGEYRPLYKYLRDRYADRVVLTFAEIEDLLGFPLPETARLQEWWDRTAPVANQSPQSVAWTLASRTATVNLVARRVLFERETPADTHPARR